jgi:hypothetical protein
VDDIGPIAEAVSVIILEITKGLIVITFEGLKMLVTLKKSV